MSDLNPGGTPYDGLYGEAPPERGIFFRLQVYERVGILLLLIFVIDSHLKDSAFTAVKRDTKF